MQQPPRLIGILLGALLVAGCGPTLVLTNSTTGPLRFRISGTGPGSVIGVGSKETFDVPMSFGSYTVQVIDATAWAAAMKDRRSVLIELLRDPGIPQTQLAAIMAELEGLLRDIDRLASGSAATCSGKITDESDGLATVTPGTDGRPSITCVSIPTEDPPFFNSPFW